MRPARPPYIPGRPAIVVLDLPAATAADRPPLLHLAVAAEPWPGAIASWRSMNAATFVLSDVVDVPAVIGTVLTPVPPGPVWRWDTRTELTLVLSGGGLASIGREAALAGGNLLALEGPDGAFEIVAAAQAELVAPRTYRIFDLLRGLGGTEDEALRTVPAGAVCVLLDEAVRPMTSSLDDLGQTLTYRIGPAARDHAHASYVEMQATVRGRSLTPLPPVHLRAVRRAEGVRLDWVRRTRQDGDGWGIADVPLGEVDERYEVDILKDGTPVRTIAVSTPDALYPTDLELADFGAPQDELAVEVAQMSRLVGRGRPRRATFPVA